VEGQAVTRGHRGKYRTDPQTSRLSDAKIAEYESRDTAAVRQACERHLQDLQKHAQFPAEQILRKRWPLVIHKKKAPARESKAPLSSIDPQGKRKDF
jgi:hypothetical protein